MKPLKETIMERDNLSEIEFDELLADFKKEFNQLLDQKASFDELQECFEDWFGLEPDYMDEVLPL